MTMAREAVMPNVLNYVPALISPGRADSGAGRTTYKMDDDRAKKLRRIRRDFVLFADSIIGRL